MINPPYASISRATTRRGPAAIETGRSVGGDAFQRRREVRLAEAVAGSVRRTVVGERRNRGGIAGHPRQDGGQRRGARVGENEPVAGQGNGRIHQAPPGKAAMVAPGPIEPGDAPGHADSDMAVVVACPVVGAAGQEHLR